MPAVFSFAHPLAVSSTNSREYASPTRGRTRHACTGSQASQAPFLSLRSRDDGRPRVLRNRESGMRGELRWRPLPLLAHLPKISGIDGSPIRGFLVVVCTDRVHSSPRIRRRRAGASANIGSCGRRLCLLRPATCVRSLRREMARRKTLSLPDRPTGRVLAADHPATNSEIPTAAISENRIS